MSGNGPRSARRYAAPPTAVSDASLSVWTGSRDGSGGLYYPKGALTGLLLDVLIRDASNNRHSLDDVMRALWAVIRSSPAPDGRIRQMSHVSGGTPRTK